MCDVSSTSKAEATNSGTMPRSLSNQARSATVGMTTLTQQPASGVSMSTVPDGPVL